MVLWLLFMLNSTVMIGLSHKLIAKRNQKRILLLASLFLLNSLLLTGRSGIVMAILILLYAFYHFNKRMAIIAGGCLGLLLTQINITSLSSSVEKVSTDLYERGARIPVREQIWECYYANLTLADIIIGFNKVQVAGRELSMIGHYDGESDHILTESSFLSLLSNTGVLGFAYILFLLLKSIILSRNYYMHFICVCALIFRIASGDFLFFTIFDFFFFSLIFNYRDSRPTNSRVSRKPLSKRHKNNRMDDKKVSSVVP